MVAPTMPDPVLPAARGNRECAIAGLDLIENRVAIVAVGHRLARRNLHLPLSLIAVVGRAGGAQGEGLGLRGEAAENILAVAVGGIGQRQQAVLNLHSLGRDGAQVRVRQNSAVGLEGQIAQALQLVCTCDSALSSVFKFVCALVALVPYCWLCARAWL